MLMDGRTDDVQTDKRRDGKPDPYIAPCLRQARQKCVHQTKILYLVTLGF